MDEDFSFIPPIDLITKDVNELRRMVLEKRRNSGKDREREKECVRERKRGRDIRGLDKVKDHDKDGEGKENDNKGGKEKVVKSGREKGDKMGREKEERVGREKNDKIFRIPKPMDISPSRPFVECGSSASHVTILEGHTSEVYSCAWSPSGSLLASASRDSTARIWTISERGSRSRNGSTNVVVLKHFEGKPNEESKDVTTLDWNGEGTLLATGSYDSQARIWNTNGDLKSTLNKHKGPIYALKWNKKGDYLLTSSSDKTVIVWDVKAGEPKQQFEFNSGSTLNVDWRNNISFAISTTGNMIYVCNVGETCPIKTCQGHQGAVNCVKWDPTGTLLASCSDDSTVKIWRLKQDSFVQNLKDHSKEINTIGWSPTGPGTNNPNQQLVLASASSDSTVKLWDVELGKVLHSLSGHRGAVYSVAFSPCSEYLASGSFDKSLHVWSLKERKIVKTYSGNGGVFEVCWNKEGNKIAACVSNNTLCVLDFRM